MKALLTGSFALAVGMAGLVAPSRAGAHDTAGAEFARSRSRAAVVAATSAAPLDPLPSSGLPAVADVAASASTAGAEPTAGSREANPKAQVDLDASDDVNIEELCEKQCGTVQKINLLPEAIFERAQALPVLGLFVVPLLSGVTVDPGQGLPPVTFAVKPTRVTQGNGLTVIGRF
jgi:hypothetical protein